MTMLDLYHRTDERSASTILREGRMVSKENDGSLYFSTERHGQAEGYGATVIHVRVPEALAELEDEFPDGEQHYRVNAADLEPEHFVGSCPVCRGSVGDHKLSCRSHERRVKGWLHD